MSCPYCKMETVGVKYGEQSNGYQLIESLDDGVMNYELFFNRYKLKRDDISYADLILSLGVEIDNSVHTLKEVSIPIKYCPFCGEEL